MRDRRRVQIEQLGQSQETGRKRVALIVSVPVLSLVLPALAVVIADAGGTSTPVQISADVERFLLYYSGVFALVALTAAVGAGLLATDRIVMSPQLRILGQGLHRMISLVALSALANHVMLEILAHRVKLIDGFVPFMAARKTFFMGLGTVASDLIIVVIITGIMRARFAARDRRWLWRSLHAFTYAAWPLAILHGLLAGRSAKPYVDWSYGACLALAGLALTLRVVLQTRGRNAGQGLPDRDSTRLPLPPHAAQVFAHLPAGDMVAGRSAGSPARGITANGRLPGTPRPALPAGQIARAPRPVLRGPRGPETTASATGWPLPGYDADWRDWPEPGRPDGQGR